MPTVVFAPETRITREALQKSFVAENIDARFSSGHRLPMFESVKTNLVARDIPTRSMNLPSYHDLSGDNLERVCEVVKSVYRAKPG